MKTVIIILPLILLPFSTCMADEVQDSIPDSIATVKRDTIWIDTLYPSGAIRDTMDIDIEELWSDIQKNGDNWDTIVYPEGGIIRKIKMYYNTVTHSYDVTLDPVTGHVIDKKDNGMVDITDKIKNYPNIQYDPRPDGGWYNCPTDCGTVCRYYILK